MFRNAVLTGLLAIAPGCLEVPEWKEPSEDASISSHVQDNAGEEGEGQNGDTPSPEAEGHVDVPSPDTEAGQDGGVDAGVPADPCYKNNFENIASLTQFIAQKGRWSIHPDGYLQQTQVGGGPQGVGYFDIGSFVNSQVRLRVRIPQQGTGDVFSQLLFRYTRQSREGYDYTLDHGYTLQVEDNGRVAVEDFYQRRLAIAEVGAAVGEWHDLMLQVLGNQIVGYLGSEEIIRLTDEMYGEGKIGLSTHAGMADFDDVEICTLKE